MTIEKNPDELDVLQFGPAVSRRQRRHLESGIDEPTVPLRLNLDDEPHALPLDEQRRRRARFTMAVMACLAVLVGGFAMRGAPPPQADEPVPPAIAEPATPPAGLELISVRFVDARRGYALASACTAGAARSCRYVFRVTADGGGTWVLQPVPLDAGSLVQEPQPTIATVGDQGVRVSGAGLRWFSPDGGRSWREPPYSTQDVADRVPAGALVDVLCRAACGQFRFTDPATGVRATLKNQPDITPLPLAGQAPTPSDGSIWLAGRRGASGPPAVAVSRDRGRTWRVSALPATSSPLDTVLVLTRNGRTAYAFVRTAGPADQDDPLQSGIANGLDELYVTTDGGRSWRPVPDGPVVRLRSIVSAALMPSGRIVVTTEEWGRANIRYSDDGGRTFPRLVEAPWPQLTTLEVAGGRYVGAGVLGGFYTSLDGVTWHRVRV